MKVFSGSGRSVKVIDRTIPEILALNNRISRVELSALFRLIVSLGVNMLEVDDRALEMIEGLHRYDQLILRLNPQKDAAMLIPENIKNCIVTETMLEDADLLKALERKGIRITLECRAYDTFQLVGLKRLREVYGFKYVKQLRLLGLESADCWEWLEAVKDLKDCLGVDLDICPQNLYYCATAIAVEALINDLGTVTTSFAGYGRCGGFAALEEVLLSVKVLTDCKRQYPLHLLPQIRSAFMRLTGMILPENKPVIGRDIFKYESGIHADGIEKNPTTYEPFDPEMVGLERSLHIGKHSGKGAVATKLKEFGMNPEAFDISSVLETIRQKSITLRRGLCDEEIKDVCGVPL